MDNSERNSNTAKKLRYRIQTVVDSDTRKQICNLNDLAKLINSKKRYSRIHQVFYLLLFLLCACTLIYQVYERTMYYYSYPIAVSVSTKSDDITLPTLSICSSNTKAIANLWNKTYTKFDTEIDFSDRTDYKCINMFRVLMKNSSYNMQELWKSTNLTKERIDMKMKGFTEATVTISEIGYYYGICPSFQFQKASSKSLVGKSLSVTFEKFYSYICPIAGYKLILSTVPEFGKIFFLASRYLGSKTIINFNYNKYLFLNSPLNPCSTTKKYKTCYKKCLSQKLSQTLTCQFPFTNVKLNLPPCNCSNETFIQYPIAFKLIKTLDPIANCGCQRACQQTSFVPSLNSDVIDDENTVTISLEPKNDKIRIYQEWFRYDVIALLSDIGGNLGLFLGLSLLSLIETGYYTFYALQNFRKWPTRNPNKHINKIMKIYERVKKNTEVLNNQRANSRNVVLNFKKIFILFAIGLLLYLLHDRVQYYNSEPITHTVSIMKRHSTIYPTVTICGEMFNVMHGMKRLKISNLTGETCNNISPWRLVDKRFTLEKIWEKLNIYNVLNVYDDISEHNTGYKTTVLLQKRFIPLPFGNCTQILGDVSEDLSAELLIFFRILPVPEICPFDHLWCFLNYVDEEVNIMKPKAVMYGSLTTITLEVSKIIRRNSKHSPCEENKKDYLKCKNICNKKNLLKRINCRLPYMQDNDLKLCKSVNETLQAHTTYLTNYKSNQKQCRCLKPCEKIFYQIIMTGDQLPVNFATVVHLKFTNDKINVILEIEAYPIAKLIGDAGSIIGLILGISLLSFYNCIFKVIKWFSLSV